MNGMKLRRRADLTASIEPTPPPPSRIRRFKCAHSPSHGFTLAELLIALMILGVIAVFTIPKVLQVQQESKFKSIGKEAAATYSAAYIAYKQQNTPIATTDPRALIPYINYVQYDTSSTVDSVQTLGSLTCSSTNPCLRMHNGAVLFVEGATSFGGTNPNNMVWVCVDPDGQYSGTTNGPGKALQFGLYYSGRITTRGTLHPNSFNSGGGPVAAVPVYDPPWFSWD